jgi:hypothetical protein
MTTEIVLVTLATFLLPARGEKAGMRGLLGWT